MSKRILLLAGEESGVIYSRRIAAVIKRTCPEAEIRGYDTYGFKTEDLGVFGYWEVLKRLFYFLRVKRTMERTIAEWKPEVVCTVDYPGLNLKLAAFAHERGVKTVHVVCPQVWAWHQGRIPKIEATLDKLCCFLPFEPKIFRPGLAEFIGHPLMEEFAAKGEIGSANSAAGKSKILALLPGSRIGEIGHHLPILLEVVRRLKAKGKVDQVLIPAANDRAYRAISQQVAKCPEAIKSLISLTHGDARAALRSATAAVVASGTATLEAALIGVPTVLVYKVGYLLGEFLKRAIKGTRYAGLANVIWERCGGQGTQPMPELLQDNFTVEKTLELIEGYLDGGEAAANARAALADSMKLLKSDGDAIEKIVRNLF